ncbi:hypothetical protein VE00_10333 [Pseudogymnoascus sp. WSF 3629]|nr:hypothetical protein VE00_10333 [Pseudogymnoascus sp. WSF 3629]
MAGYDNKPKVLNGHIQFPPNMDYNYYANANQQPYQFLGLPPTPSRSNINGDDFGNGSPPAFEQFQTFDAYNQFDAHGGAQPPTPQSQHQSSVANTNDSHDGSSENLNSEQRQASNSDDEDMTPAQSRRKAQNRAAQRAFRERKERHVKELEEQVAELKKERSSFATQNEILRLNLQKVSTENEILKATSSNRQGETLVSSTGPLRYSPTDFYTELLKPHENKTISHRIVMDPVSGGRLLAAAAAWDFIISHPLAKQGVVDIPAVSEKLKSKAKCDGQGPVFAEGDIIAAIEDSVVGDGDELL